MGKNDPTAEMAAAEEVVDEEIKMEDYERYSLVEKEREASEEAFKEFDISSLITEEPTGGEEIATAQELEEEARVSPREAPAAPVRPQLRIRTVSGTYKCTKRSWDLDLRVDIDGNRPMRCVSADFFQTTGWTKRYFGSVIVHGVSVRIVGNMYVIEGLGRFTWSAGAPKVRVVIPRRNMLQPRGAAQLMFLTMSNQPGARYMCYYNSPYYRVVQLEQDHVKGVRPFRSYDTGQLPSGGPRRRLSVIGAYKEAGVDMQATGEWNAVDPGAAGSNARWSNSELHNAMQSQFSMWREHPQWKVWLLAANIHDMGSGLLGIMFDQKGKQRQGCAVFHAGVGGTTADKQRLQLYTYVHELGHCFNLFHSFHKSYMDPPSPNRPKSLSWMNYPWKYPGGPNVFWNAFPFKFDALEVKHLRHGYFMNVVMGGHPFGKGAAVINPAEFSDTIEDNSGLRLDIQPVKNTLVLGEPVHAELRLSVTDLRGKDILTPFHPYGGVTQIAIRTPSGDVTIYEPLMECCFAGETQRLDANNPSVYESAYIGFGKDGFYFDQIGTYELRAVYHGIDGSEVISDTVVLRVRPPLDETEEQIADRYLGTDQGHLFWLEGSDSPFLPSGQASLEEVVADFPDHRLANYARKTIGLNMVRGFKTFDPQTRSITLRESNYQEALPMIEPVLKSAEKQEILGNVEFNQMTRTLARAELEAGDKKSAKARTDRVVKHLKKLNVGKHIVQYVTDQMTKLLAG